MSKDCGSRPASNGAHLLLALIPSPTDHLRSQFMDNRIDAAFAKLKDSGEKGFVAYICAGDPDFNRSKTVGLALAKAGATVLELGVPFSDPLADGVVNQMAAQRALNAGMTLSRVLDLAAEIRKESEIALVLFAYLNPIYRYGFERFLRDAELAGIDGLLLLDLPPDEAAFGKEFQHPSSLRRIQLIAPTTSPERFGAIAKAASGFIYYVSREGVTGEQTTLSDSIGSQVEEIRKHTDLPIVVGFGISTAEQSAAVAKSADAVVVGSAIVKRVAEYADSPELVNEITRFVRPLIEAARTAG